jgi:hypothetical protein
MTFGIREFHAGRTGIRRTRNIDGYFCARANGERILLLAWWNFMRACNATHYLINSHWK